MSTATLENEPTAPAEIPGFAVTLTVRRFDPDVDAEPYWQSFDLEMFGTDRVLDALHKIKWEQDGSLSFRRSCAHGVCGSDAMRINGRNRLACKTLLKDLDISKPIYVEAIKGLPLEKDLIVDMDPFFESFKAVQPFLMASSKPEKERLQSPVQRERFDDTTKCILCAACTSSCPVFWTDGQYFAGRGREGSPRHPQRQRGCLALPHDLQLHGCLPSRHRGHQGDLGSEAGHHPQQPRKGLNTPLVRADKHPAPAPVRAKREQPPQGASAPPRWFHGRKYLTTEEAPPRPWVVAAGHKLVPGRRGARKPCRSRLL
jgi:succinate dehydrogenase / fumarate reductase iron-sulfur subunit